MDSQSTPSLQRFFSRVFAQVAKSLSQLQAPLSAGGFPLWRILPRDVRTLTFCQLIFCLIKPKVKLLAGEQKATESRLRSRLRTQAMVKETIG